jgi:hypothetical protein
LYEQISHTTDLAPYSIHYTAVAADAEPALYLHWHKEMEFLLLTGGDLLFQIEDASFELHTGDAIFIPSGTLHCAKSISDRPVSFYAFVFSSILSGIFSGQCFRAAFFCFFVHRFRAAFFCFFVHRFRAAFFLSFFGQCCHAAFFYSFF